MACPTFTSLHDAAPWWCLLCSFCPKTSFSLPTLPIPFTCFSCWNFTCSVCAPHPSTAQCHEGRPCAWDWLNPALPGPLCLELKQRWNGQSSDLQNNLRVYKRVFWETVITKFLTVTNKDSLIDKIRRKKKSKEGQSLRLQKIQNPWGIF